jgi:hypothetical protein
MDDVFVSLYTFTTFRKKDAVIKKLNVILNSLPKISWFKRRYRKNVLYIIDEDVGEAKTSRIRRKYLVILVKTYLEILILTILLYIKLT